MKRVNDQFDDTQKSNMEKKYKKSNLGKLG